MTPAKFSIGDTVQVVGIASRRVILSRSTITSRMKIIGSVNVETGLKTYSDGWGYELLPKPEMRLRYISEANLRPIPEAGDDWSTLVARLNDPANIEWMETT